MPYYFCPPRRQWRKRPEGREAFTKYIKIKRRREKLLRNAIASNINKAAKNILPSTPNTNKRPILPSYPQPLFTTIVNIFMARLKEREEKKG